MAVDLPHVIDYRRELLPELERETYLAGDAFSEDWIRQVRTEFPDAPILVTAGGLFIILKKIRSLPFCVRWDNLEIWKLFLTP